MAKRQTRLRDPAAPLAGRPAPERLASGPPYESCRAPSFLAPIPGPPRLPTRTEARQSYKAQSEGP